MQRILFQGDSITDVGRSREVDRLSGSGYPTLIAAQLGYEAPGAYEFLNRGISGNRISDLLARIKVDIINLQPDVLSILIGVNDVWHEAAHQNGVHTALYETLYDVLITEVKAALPEIRILILEPFVLRGSATEAAFDEFSAEVPLRAAAAKRVAEKHGLEYIPLQEKFEAACRLAPPEYWLADGVHPTPAGHELIARAWLEQFAR